MPFVLLLSVFICTCVPKKRAVDCAFYYWKNEAYALDTAEVRHVSEMKSRKLYVRMFDVSENAVWGAIPVAKSGLYIEPYEIERMCEKNPTTGNIVAALEIVPVVFIKNEVFRDLNSVQLDSLAGNIVYLSGKYLAEHFPANHPQTKEIQIDCDWTAKTRDSYFNLLRAVKTKSRLRVTCTLRLYAYKYSRTMGVPPADGATLMCYNLINPLKAGDKNSILEVGELKQYLTRTEPYPLHLDVALPLFSWGMVYKQGAFAGILRPGELPGTTDLKQENNSSWYTVVREVQAGSLYLREGDRLKIERVSVPALREAALAVANALPRRDAVTVTFFHLDQKIIHDYQPQALDNLCRLFY